MKAGWVAATVRARNLAQRRVGAGRCHQCSTTANLSRALTLLTDSSYSEPLTGVTTLAAAQRATRETLLWQLRVLAGWLPPGGTGLVRAAAGAYERDNIVALARQLAGGTAAPAPYDVGGLATAWPRLRGQTTAPGLAEALRRSPWGTPGAVDLGGLGDVLTLVWLRRLASAAPSAQVWTRSAGVLLACRLRLVDDVAPSARVLSLIHPWLGREWEGAQNLAGFRAALPGPARTILEGVVDPSDLWRAEARLRVEVEADGLRLLRRPLPGPDVVLGAIAVLAIDGWRLRAALAAADAGTGSSEVLDAVA